MGGPVRLVVTILPLLAWCESVNEEVTPIEKAVTLLKQLQAELQTDAEDDGKSFLKYKRWYNGEKRSATRILTETTETIGSAESDLEELQAFRDEKGLKLGKAANELAKNEKELQDAKDRRKEEHAAFEKKSVTLVDATDQLGRSLEVLGKKFPGDEGGGAPPGSGGASLVAVAKKLRRVLEEGTDFSLSVPQRETLDGFLRVAVRGAVTRRRTTDADKGLAPDFLQVQEGSSEPLGEYQSQAGSLVPMLQSVLDKTQRELEGARLQEQKSQKVFKMYEGELAGGIKNNEQAMAEMKMQISQSQEKSGQVQSELLAARDLLKATKQQLVQLESGFAAKSRSFKVRVSKRSDELMAVQEAMEILSRDGGLLQPKPPGAADGQPVGFLQIARAAARRRGDVAASAAPAARHEPGLALLALKTRMVARRASVGTRADPFAKVKTLVRGMLRKLTEEQNEESQHAAWCDSELAKSTKSKKEKEKDVQTLKDRMEALDAELAKLSDDLGKVQRDLDDMRKATSAAADVRATESAQAVSSLAKYKDAQQVLEAAIAALTKFYKTGGGGGAGGKSSAKASNEEYKANGMGDGIIGILEIAQQDFADLQKETELGEGAAQKDFKDLMDESRVRTAVFEKDLEMKSRTKTRLEGDRMRASLDLKSYEQELDAISTYLEKLKSSCVVQPDSYAERKARREDELRSLKEALEYLSSESSL